MWQYSGAAIANSDDDHNLKFNRNAAGHLPSLSAKAKAPKAVAVVFVVESQLKLKAQKTEKPKKKNKNQKAGEDEATRGTRINRPRLWIAAAPKTRDGLRGGKPPGETTGNVQHFSCPLGPGFLFLFKACVPVPCNHKTSPLAPHKIDEKKKEYKAEPERKNGAMGK